MTRQVYINGRYLPYRNAMIHVEDRGFQFADAIYEVCEINSGHIVDLRRHLARLRRSLAELDIEFSMSDRALTHVMCQIIRRNRVVNGTLYLQVTRGAAPRDFVLPLPPVAPTLVCMARASRPGKMASRAEQGISVISTRDTRWARSDIKTVMLLPAVLAKQTAADQRAREAWFLDKEGYVTEGASSTAWIVTKDKRLVTRALSQRILPGVTRATLIDCLNEEGLTLEERSFLVCEAMAAAEAFVTSASATVMPVVRIDNVAIGDGKPGPITRMLRRKFHDFSEFAKV